MASEQAKKFENKIKKLEQQFSAVKIELEETKSRLETEQEKHRFYQLVVDFTFGWELWFDPERKIKYCSPSALDLTGYTANQIITSYSISELLVYSTDRERFDQFISQSIDQAIINKMLEFRILTRTMQLRWCSASVRAVYNAQGRYLGIRASIQDITRLKQAMGHIQELSENKEMDSRTRQRLATELEMKERELVSFLLQLSKKNELISSISNKLDEIKLLGNKQKDKEIERLQQLITSSKTTPIDWEMINVQLEKLYPGFLKRLFVKHPRLTTKEKKLCASLKLGLSSKEIAGLSNIAPKSVEVARVRLRKKLNVPEKTRLTHYIEQV